MGNSMIKKLGGSTIHKHYEVKGKLGSGSFAVVKLAVDRKTKQEVAIKIINKKNLQQKDLDLVHEEVAILHAVNHKNCVRLYEMLEGKKHFYIVLELLDGGELFDRIVAKGSYSEEEAAMVIKSLADAIKYLHSVGVVHRDLKPENVIYASKNKSEPELKITDFGLAHKCTSGPEKMLTACGTPGYVAPEVLMNLPYGPAVDLWSLGVMLFILLCGYPPFYSTSNNTLFTKIKKGQYTFASPYWDEISESAKDLVQKLLVVNPETRMTAVQVLEHPWVNGKASKDKFKSAHGKSFALMQARRNLRKGVQSIISLNRFKSSLMELHANGTGGASAESTPA